MAVVDEDPEPALELLTGIVGVDGDFEWSTRTVVELSSYSEPSSDSGLIESLGPSVLVRRDFPLVLWVTVVTLLYAPILGFG